MAKVNISSTIAKNGTTDANFYTWSTFSFATTTNIDDNIAHFDSAVYDNKWIGSMAVPNGTSLYAKYEKPEKTKQEKHMEAF